MNVIQRVGHGVKRKVKGFVFRCFVDELKAIQEHEAELHKVRKELAKVNETLKVHKRLIDLLSEEEIVAIDHHIKDKSWIVMVDKRNGGRNNVRFYSLEGDTPFADVLSILEHYKYEHLAFDGHPTFAQHLHKANYF